MVIFSMVGIMQIGLGQSVVNASPPIQQQGDQDQVRHEAELIENERHDRAMERNQNDSDQDRENQRH